MFRAEFALPVYDLIVTVDGSPIVRLRLLGLLTLSDTLVATQWLYSEGVVPAKKTSLCLCTYPNDSDQSLVICNL